MGGISREQMGNATSVFNRMRNIGSSVGIAAVTTLLSRRRALRAEILATHVLSYSQDAMRRVGDLQAYFESRGADATTALARAYAALDGLVEQQAALLSFIDAFYVLGIVFLAMLPLLCLMRKPAARSKELHVTAE